MPRSINDIRNSDNGEQRDGVKRTGNTLPLPARKERLDSPLSFPFQVEREVSFTWLYREGERWRQLLQLLLLLLISGFKCQPRVFPKKKKRKIIERAITNMCLLLLYFMVYGLGFPSPTPSPINRSSRETSGGSCSCKRCDSC